MAVHDGVHVRPCAIGGAVDEPLQEYPAVALIDWIGVEVELHDVLGGHERRRQRARHQVAVWIRRMPDAHMPGFIEHALLGQDAIGRDEVFDENWSDRSTGCRRFLGGSGTPFDPWSES